MENSLAELSGWHLQICLLDKVDHVPFASRMEAVEYADTLVREFGPFISVAVCSPCGVTETLQKRSAKIYGKVRTLRCYR